MKHLLIDFENVQPQNLDKLAAEDTHIWLFLGVNHKMLPISLVQSLLRFGERVHLVQLQRSGKNALDFYLSYYLGQITAGDPSAQIGILSHDGGYDVLVEHILANRHAQDILRLADIEEVSHLPPYQSSGKIEYAPFKTEPVQPKQSEKEVWQPDEAVWKKIMAVLSLAKAKRPKTVTALCNTIKSHAKSDTRQTQKLLQHLQDKKLLRIDGTKIIYL